MQGNLGQSETIFWLINCSLKIINMIKLKLDKIRPWSFFLKLEKSH